MSVIYHWRNKPIIIIFIITNLVINFGYSLDLAKLNNIKELIDQGLFFFILLEGGGG